MEGTRGSTAETGPQPKRPGGQYCTRLASVSCCLEGLVGICGPLYPLQAPRKGLWASTFPVCGPLLTSLGLLASLQHLSFLPSSCYPHSRAFALNPTGQSGKSPRLEVFNHHGPHSPLHTGPALTGISIQTPAALAATTHARWCEGPEAGGGLFSFLQGPLDAAWGKCHQGTRVKVG